MKPYSFPEQKKLLDWFYTHKRSLPWRTFNKKGTRNPYKTWISEIMLQQTQVSTVIPYFQHWMKKFPNLKTLAKAPEGEVLEAWSGLGYYSRARNLRLAAQQIVKNFKGLFPHDKEAVLSLKGVGEYTAGAILSLAYNQKEPILDGNLIRLFSRYYGILFYPKNAVEKETYWKWSRKWVQCESPQGVNEALMELGALVCVPKNPRCGDCPLSKKCYAFEKGRQEELPPLKERKKTSRIQGWALVVIQGDEVLVSAPGKKALLPHQFTFPIIEGNSVFSTKNLKADNGADKDERAEIQKHFPFLKKSPLLFDGGRVKHAITHHKIELKVVCTSLKRNTPIRLLGKGFATYEWLPIVDIDQKLVASLSKKIWKRALMLQ